MLPAVSHQNFVPYRSVIIIGSDKETDDNRKNNTDNDKEGKQHAVQGEFFIIFCHNFITGKQHEGIPYKDEGQTEAKGEGTS